LKTLVDNGNFSYSASPKYFPIETKKIIDKYSHEYPHRKAFKTTDSNLLKEVIHSELTNTEYTSVREFEKKKGYTAKTIEKYFPEGLQKLKTLYQEMKDKNKRYNSNTLGSISYEQILAELDSFFNKNKKHPVISVSEISRILGVNSSLLYFLRVYPKLKQKKSCNTNFTSILDYT
jgi:hypothetical protein